MSSADDVWASFLRRTGGTDLYRRSPGFQHGMDHIRDVMGRLEIILEDEEIDPATIGRILRSVMYGSPHMSAAEDLERLHEHMRKILMTHTPTFIQIK